MSLSCGPLGVARLSSALAGRGNHLRSLPPGVWTPFPAMSIHSHGERPYGSPFVRYAPRVCPFTRMAYPAPPDQASQPEAEPPGALPLRTPRHATHWTLRGLLTRSTAPRVPLPSPCRLRRSGWSPARHAAIKIVPPNRTYRPLWGATWHLPCRTACERNYQHRIYLSRQKVQQLSYTEPILLAKQKNAYASGCIIMHTPHACACIHLACICKHALDIIDIIGTHP